METRTASCSCGQLRIEVAAEPNGVGICHCLACQRRTGSVFAAVAGFPLPYTVSGKSTAYVRTGDAGCGFVYHFCPVCGTTVQQIHRPGRARIYCTNGCRQRAYRWRRANGVRICVERTGPVERMITYGRRHALRDPRDPVARVTDRRDRLPTVCGTFAIPSTRMRFTHYDFLPDHPWSCAT